MPAELPKAYEPKKYEDDIYARWEDSGYFHPDKCVEDDLTDIDAPHFSMVLPPPNVTGTLHMGHAAMLAIQDVIARHHRMRGDKTLWIPGTDHAAIATQAKVEKLLIEKEGLKDPRQELGREGFLERVREFAQESHDTIVRQCRKMGASLDWKMEAYTLDEARNLAVTVVFKKMYDDGLIYRGGRVVNWDPKMQSNVSDDEIVWKEEKAPFYYFQYGPFVIGTVRPETKFGDKYVVMHPDDERYKEYRDGQQIELEWINGPITATIIKDAVVDPKFGSGVMTITPWHSAVDFDLAERRGLDKEQVIGYDGKLMPIANEFTDMDAYEARSKIVEKLRQKGLVVKIEDNYIHNVATNYRGGGIIEPQIREQWFVAVNKEFSFHQSPYHPIKGLKDGQKVTLKQLMRQVVESAQIEIIPDRFNKTYFHWIDNLRDWCISRQIWFGHRIPVWYKGEEIYVGVKTPASEGWTQDQDTLDTWFSSGLWTFSTLEWPGTENPTAEYEDENIYLKYYHPTSVLETGYDILFFWVARMILMTTYTLGEIPFRTVYLHGLVRDDKGRKMSKSLGNVIDPLDMIEKYGADATRLSLLVGNTPGNDMKLSEEKIAGFRNFTNKLWNIARFMLLKIEKPDSNATKPEAVTVADKWILDRLEVVVNMMDMTLQKFQFSGAGELLRYFTWDELADWYLEIAKIEGNKSKILNYILNTVLKLWHPFMPFVTEAIWREVYGQEKMLMVEKWPAFKEFGEKDFSDFDLIKNIITGIRSLRAEYKIEPAKKINAAISAGDRLTILKENEAVIKGLARLENITIETKIEKPANAVGFVVGSIEVFIELSGVVDLEKEKTRLGKEIAELEKYIAGVESKLSNQDFVSHAPAAVVAGEKKKLEEAKGKLNKLQEQYKFLR